MSKMDILKPFSINKDSYLKAIKHSLVIIGTLGILFIILYFAILRPLGTYVFAAFIFMIGGILLLISGFVGPGRYFERRNLLIIVPQGGSSYFENIPVSAICMKQLEEIKIIVNDKEVDTLEFENGLGQKLVSRDKVPESIVNSMILKAGEHESNSVNFTFFDFSENMSDEEIDEYAKYDNLMDLNILKSERQNYVDKLESNPGSYSFGMFTMGVITLLMGVLLENNILY